MPSCVAYTELDVVVGEEADYQAASNLSDTFFDVKRIIGRRFNDEMVTRGVKARSWSLQTESAKADRVTSSSTGLSASCPLWTGWPLSPSSPEKSRSADSTHA